MRNVSDKSCRENENKNFVFRGNKMPTRCNRWYLLQILLHAQHVSGNTMPIISSSRVLYRWSLPVVFGALVFRLSVWCGAEGYVSGLQAANRTHNGFILNGQNNQILLEDGLINTTTNLSEYPVLRITDFETGTLQARPLLSFQRPVANILLGWKYAWKRAADF